MALSSRETVIQRLRKALIHPSDPPLRVRPEQAAEDPFEPIEEDLALAFAKRLLQLKGQFVYAETQAELATYLTKALEGADNRNLFCLEPEIQDLLQKSGLAYRVDTDRMEEAGVGVTGCEALIAWSGSVMVSSAQAFGRSSHGVPAHSLGGGPQQSIGTPPQGRLWPSASALSRSKLPFHGFDHYRTQSDR